MPTKKKHPKLFVQCETCKWWKRGDPSANRFGNAGLCTWALLRSSLSFGRSKHVPFWLRYHARTTVSFDGADCPVHEFASKKQQAENAKP